jgi:predicted aspartyl protease
MIVGVVNRENEAVIQVTVRGPLGRDATVAAIIDTGFGGALTLPPDLVEALQLPVRREATAILGDGSETDFTIHRATVLLG